MKKSLKLLVLPAAMILIAGNATSCSPSMKEVAMISDVGDINDGSFNQSCWEALKDYCKGKYSYDYYRPFADSEFARECAIRQAVAKGARIIVLPGFKFKDVANKVANQDQYKNIHFVLIDDHAAHTPNRNLISFKYDFQYSGWLAGYAIGRDYFETDWELLNGRLADKYGFGFCCGNKFNSVYPFGYGYIQGILYAAQEFCEQKGITDDSKKPELTFKTNYAYVFAQDDSACARVKGWVASEGIQCVFPCGGKLYQSITEAVKYYNNHILDSKYRNFKNQEAPREAVRWVGVDGDQYNLVQDEEEKKSIYTSALKDLGHTVKVCLDYEMNNKFDDLYKMMEEQYQTTTGFQLGFNVTNFKLDSETSHSYVGIPLETKEDNVTLRSFRKFKKDAITNETTGKIKMIEEQIKKGKVIYNGENEPTFGNDGDFESLNSQAFKDSDYNKFDKTGIQGFGTQGKYTKYKVYEE